MYGGDNMKSPKQLLFFQSILKELFISSYILEEPAKSISPEIDLHLREELFGSNNYTNHLKNTFAQVKEHTVYRFFDEYNCHYIFLKLSENESSYFFVGPYLTEIPSRADIEGMALFSKNEDAVNFLLKYYSSLPILENENLLLSMISALAKELWNNREDISMEYIDYAIPDGREPVENSPIGRTLSDTRLALATIEKNYANEKLLMEAVSSGKLHRLTAVAASVYNNGAEERLSDSLRDRKNYLIILKTLLRKAAEYGGVHPLHIHRVSSDFAKEIERLHTIKQSLALQETMIRSYCMLVKKYSLKKYSLYVSRAITLIQYDLTADLSLAAIAARLNVNASYLSDLFHREYGMTLTEYVVKERIDNAVHLLKNTKKTVQEVAAECGILDASYFTKLFKKHIGMTPNKYRETSLNQSSAIKL